MRKTWELIRPTAVLVIVCAVISGLLALTYNLAGVAALENAGYTEEELAEYAAAALPEADRLEQAEVQSEEKALQSAGIGTPSFSCYGASIDFKPVFVN